MILSFEFMLLKKSPEFEFLSPPVAVKFLEKTKSPVNRGCATALAGLQNTALRADKVFTINNGSIAQVGNLSNGWKRRDFYPISSGLFGGIQGTVGDAQYIFSGIAVFWVNGNSY